MATTEATEPSTEATEPSTEATESADEADKPDGKAKKPGDKGKKPADEATEPSTEPSTEATEPSTEPSTEATEPSTEATEPSTEATEPSTEATEPEVIAVTGITLDQTALEVGVGELPIILTATVLPEDATDKTVTWTSSNPDVAFVEDGFVQFGMMGEAVITATAGDFSAECTVLVGEGEWSVYDGTTYVLAGSDFQPTDASNTTGVNLLNMILDEVDDVYTTMDGFIFAGDYDYNYSASQSGKEALQDAVQAKYGTAMDEIYIQGNHDNDSLVGSTLTASGNNDTEAYGVYVINEKDYMWYNDDETTIKNTAASLKSYLNAKRNAGYTKPIFVVSHLPLHYCMRTQVGGGDGKHANYIFDVLNEAGAAGLNIIFMFGHNHSHGWDDPYGGAAIFLKKGDSINIAQNSTTNYDVETLKFTYLNAGYVSYYRNVNSGAETDLSMTTFEITDSAVTIRRFTADGEHALKSAGVANTHASTGSSVDGSCSTNHGGKETYSPDTTTVASGYVMTLNTEITPAGSEPEQPEASVERVTSLQQGVPYIITCDRNDKVLTNDVSDNMLQLSGTPSVDTAHLWYYNGTNLIYGDPSSADAYLLIGAGTASIGAADGTQAASNVFLNDDGETFSIGASNGQYLNQYGGSSAAVAAGYTSDGNSDDGSKWRIYALNTATDADPAVLTVGDLTMYVSGVKGASAKAASQDDLALLNAKGYEAYKVMDISATIAGESATISTPIPNGWDASRMVAFSVEDGAVKEIVGVVADGMFTFVVDHFSAKGIAERATVNAAGGNWVTITEPVDSSTKYVYELDTNGIDTGVEYLIVANSHEKALSAAASSNNAVDIDIEGNFAYATSDTYGWTFTRDSNGVYYIRLNGSTYLRLNDDALGSSDSAGSSRRWTVTNKNDGSYDIVRGSYDLRWSNSNGVFQVSSSNEGPVRLYKYVRTDTTAAQSGLYGKIVDNGADGSADFSFNVAIGTTAANAIAEVQAGIDVLYHTGDESAAIPLTADEEKSLITWTLDPSYDGVTPGEYAVTIKYGEVTLGVAKVVVPEVAISSYAIDPLSAAVRQGTAQSVQTGSKITVTLADGNYYTVPVTLSMLSKDGKAVSTATPGTYEGLTVTYNGVVITREYTLTVNEKVINNYPEYPDEGAVKVNKTATGIDFQSTGVAQVELSASGVPAKKGADVVVVIDTSSSMDDIVDEQMRIDVLRASLEQMLTQFQTRDDSGNYPDIDIAIIDFNGYYPNSAEDYDKIQLNGGGYRENKDYATVFTGTNAGRYIKEVGLSAGNFVDALTLDADEIAANFTVENIYSGTNYDGALENAYTLLSAKQAANGDEERDSYVIFLSDGAPFRYNGFNNSSTKSGYPAWDAWLDGDYTANNVADYIAADYDRYASFYNGDGNKHPHRWAEAIKGVPGQNYSVVDRNYEGYTGSVNGLGAQIYSIGFCLADDGERPEAVTTETMREVIEVISSGAGFSFPNVTSKSQLDEAFTQIVTAINYAASNARFVDQMGENFDLKITPITDLQGNAVTDDNGNTVTPKIEIIQYDIWTRAEYEAGKCTEQQIGVRKGKYTILETVTFNDAGTEAYSDGGTTNIMTNGVIDAKYFWYNNNATSVMIDPDGDGTNDYELPSETFYWKMGTVTTYELAMRYYVYLEGSKEGTRPAGSYPTNEYAILYYDNHLGNPCEKPTVSPVMAWKSANVSYAFYLVDENGKIIVNQTTGETGTFANKVAITNPVVYQEILLNNTDQVEALKVAALGENVLPTYYQIYDAEAVYTISIYSDATGSWKITQGDGTVASTYVTQYDPADSSNYSNALNENGAYDYTHTVVWFAVVWSVQAHPDTVVIDYGLPVDISVLTNDMFGENGKLAGIGAYTNGIENTSAGASMAAGFGDEYTGTYGTAVINGDEVRYTPDDMEMNGYDKFAYAVNYTGTTNPGFYYDTVTVIPATTIYYEDDFVTLKSYTWSGGWKEVDETDKKWVWTQEGETVAGATQDEDRPGEYALTDANNIYGYDSVNKAMSTYSMGSAMKASVDYDNYGSAEFTFYGTGFDVISMTSNTTGMIFVDVYQNGTKVEDKSFAVDTYYGYKQVSGDADGDGSVEDGELVWEVDPDANGSIYQVPVIKVEGLTYGQYTAKITAYYNTGYDHVSGSDSYDFYLDAIRIYDPANDGASDGTTDTTIEDAYKADGEGWPSYFELRNHIIGENKLNTDDGLGDVTTNTKVTGLVFIDGDAEVGEAQISDYVSYGPNNEVYLAPGQRVAFILDVPSNIANVHIGIKSADGIKGTYTITNIAQADNTETGVTAGDYYNAKTATIDTTTDMYYDITGYKGDIIVISNTGDKYDTTGIISLTNVKFTYTRDPNAVTTASEDYGIAVASDELPANEGSLYMTPVAATLTLRSLNAPVSAEPDTEPTEPDTEPTEPETKPTEPDIEPTEPETEPTQPEETEPEEDSKDEQIAKVVKSIKKVIDWLKGWFGW